MVDDLPDIPIKHLLKTLKESMEACLKLLEEEGPQALQDRLRRESGSSRPWRILKNAYEEHDEDHRWFQQWCQNCMSLL
jgi:hypothetical protein